MMNSTPFQPLLDTLAQADGRPATVDVFPCRSNPNRTWYVIEAATCGAVQAAIDQKMDLVSGCTGSASFDNPKRGYDLHGQPRWRSVGHVVIERA